MTDQYKGYTIDINQDEFADSPRDWGSPTQMICFQRRYDLGDKHSYNSDDYDGWDELSKAISKKGDLIAPLYLYDHSGLRIKIGSFQGLLPQGHAEFDSGQVGFIVFTREKIREHFEVKRITPATLKKAQKLMEQDVSYYDSYISGSVYQYTVTDEDGEVIESCGGYYDYDMAETDAKTLVDSLKEVK